MKNLTKVIFYDFIAAKSHTSENYPLDELFFDEAVEKVAQKNDMSTEEVSAIVYSALAEIKGLDVSTIASTVEDLRTERELAHKKADDWKESLMVERDIIEKQKELLDAGVPDFK